MRDLFSSSFVNETVSAARRLSMSRVVAPSVLMLGLAVVMSMPHEAGGAQSASRANAGVVEASGQVDVAARWPLMRPEVSTRKLFALTPAPRFSAEEIHAMNAIARFTAALPPPAPPVAPEPEAAPAAPPTEQPAAPAPVAVPRAAPPAPPLPPPPPPAPAVQGLDTSPMNGYEQALFDDTNRRRVASGLPALRVNLALVGLARIRSRDMAANNYFSHTSPSGDTAFSLMDRYGVGYSWAGENLAKNNYPDAQAVGVADETLWNSPPHRENILGPNYTQMGVALAVDASGMKYFTILFIG